MNTLHHRCKCSLLNEAYVLQCVLYCAPFVADCLFSYENDGMLSLSDNNQADVIEAFNSTSRYLDD